VLQCVAECVNTIYNWSFKAVWHRDSVFKCMAGCCRVLQGVAGCCSVLQCVAMCCRVL